MLNDHHPILYIYKNARDEYVPQSCLISSVVNLNLSYKLICLSFHQVPGFEGGAIIDYSHWFQNSAYNFASGRSYCLQSRQRQVFFNCVRQIRVSCASVRCPKRVGSLKDQKSQSLIRTL